MAVSKVDKFMGIELSLDGVACTSSYDPDGVCKIYGGYCVIGDLVYIAMRLENSHWSSSTTFSGTTILTGLPPARNLKSAGSGSGNSAALSANLSGVVIYVTPNGDLSRTSSSTAISNSIFFFNGIYVKA